MKHILSYVRLETEIVRRSCIDQMRNIFALYPCWIYKSSSLLKLRSYPISDVFQRGISISPFREKPSPSTKMSTLRKAGCNDLQIAPIIR